MWTEAVKRIKQALGQMRSSFLVFFPFAIIFWWVRVDLRGSGSLVDLGSILVDQEWGG
jgi:hypothetical protein